MPMGEEAVERRVGRDAEVELPQGEEAGDRMTDEGVQRVGEGLPGGADEPVLLIVEKGGEVHVKAAEQGQAVHVEGRRDGHPVAGFEGEVLLPAGGLPEPGRGEEGLEPGDARRVRARGEVERVVEREIVAVGDQLIPPFGGARAPLFAPERLHRVLAEGEVRQGEGHVSRGEVLLVGQVEAQVAPAGGPALAEADAGAGRLLDAILIEFGEGTQVARRGQVDVGREAGGGADRLVVAPSEASPVFDGEVRVAAFAAAQPGKVEFELAAVAIAFVVAVEGVESPAAPGPEAAPELEVHVVVQGEIPAPAAQVEAELVFAVLRGERPAAAPAPGREEAKRQPEGCRDVVQVELEGAGVDPLLVDDLHLARAERIGRVVDAGASGVGAVLDEDGAVFAHLGDAGPDEPFLDACPGADDPSPFGAQVEGQRLSRERFLALADLRPPHHAGIDGQAGGPQLAQVEQDGDAVGRQFGIGVGDPALAVECARAVVAGA
ncbi:MAG: hypothetical protein KatS3mg044_0474 [Rhodothermaceae bacterium]|nr:MAG: hypothetical protein KatS3mg044_0474 [Rhodothermaceae bacterium]